MASNSGAPNPGPWPPSLQRDNPLVFPCPRCRKEWSTHQALGGHMSKNTCVASRPNALAPLPYSAPAIAPPAAPTGHRASPIPLWLLAPNPAFWATYRREAPPVEINFLGLLEAPVVNGNAQPVHAAAGEDVSSEMSP
ncbi:hypothetical protein ZWY2020_022008 [Hordeum vulgare]|nr:hypothetical protein ZWY2020_022008 [Hordeum vulgare]